MFLSCLKHPDPALGLTNPPLQRALGTLSAEIKRSRREDGRSPPSSEKFKNQWSCTSTPYALTTCTGTNLLLL